MKNYHPSKGFILTLLVILLIAVGFRYYIWNYRSCMEVAGKMILKSHPEFVNIQQFDDQGDEIYFRAIPKENNGAYYIVKAAMSCDFIGGVKGIEIRSIAPHKNH